TYVSGDTNQNGILDLGEIWIFRAVRTAILGQYMNIATVRGTGAGRALVGTDAANYFGIPVDETVLFVEKAVNAVDPLHPTLAEDADSPTGPRVTVGSQVVFTYLVTAVGGPVSALMLRDDSGTPFDPSDDFTPVYVSGDTNGDGILDPGEIWYFRAVRAAILGQYTNVATARGAAGDAPLVATDAANYFGVPVEGTELFVEKAVNAVDPLHPTSAEDADLATGPTLIVGSQVVFTYLVSAVGGPVSSVTLRDDNGTPGTPNDDFTPVFVSGDTNGNGILDLGEVWLYRAIRTAVLGQYANIATARGTAGGVSLDATDVANYLGIPVGLVSIDKAVNAASPLAPTAQDDADTAVLAKPIGVGTAVVWTYLVRSLTTSSLHGVTVVDDNGTPDDASDDFTAVYVSGDANGNGLLDPGEVWLFTSLGVRGFAATAGLYGNTATVTAYDEANAPATARDAAYHFGAIALPEIVKYVNGQDAATAPGIELPVGGPVTWTYEVRNLGNIALAVTVTDDNGTPANPADDFAPAYVSGDTNGNGLVDPGEVWLSRATGSVTEGAYVNTATVVGTVPGTAITGRDSDDAHHVGVVVPPTGIVVVKRADGQDADTAAAAVRVIPGSTIEWTFAVRLIDGSLPLGGIVLVDDRGTADTADDVTLTLVSGDVNGNGILETGEVWLYRWTTIATAGAFRNVATVVGADRFGRVFTDDDPAHVYGAVVGIDVEKAINAVDPWHPNGLEDADTSGPQLLAGNAIVWTYLVRNTGNTPISVSLVDDNGTPGNAADDFAPTFVGGDTNGNGLLDPDEVWLYSYSSTVRTV
ncbi:MAG TPA: hypothetical protein VL916_18340, partial [Ilumatobacteraceae bacterium]|nr:hypothetical protein [Ilumatobacteraceae bacterium]